MEIVYDKEKGILTLSQAKYIDLLQKKFIMLASKEIKTPFKIN